MWCPMISMRALSLLALACLNFVLQPLAAEEVVRPKVGLVLGGGGARGAAHIGHRGAGAAGQQAQAEGKQDHA